MGVKKIEEGWQYFKQQPLDDPIWLVLVSPSDPDDYIAFGDARLYWFDDDEKPSEEEEREIAAKKLRRTSSGASEYAKVIGKLSYIDYHPPAAAAADGSDEVAPRLLLPPQPPDIVADGAHHRDGGRLIVAADVRKLPAAPSATELEASRVCVLLNALREWLHDDTCDLEKLREEVGASQLQNQPITPQTLHFNLDCAAEHGANANPWREPPARSSGGTAGERGTRRSSTIATPIGSTSSRSATGCRTRCAPPCRWC